MSTLISQKIGVAALLVFQSIFIILFAIFCNYDRDGKPIHQVTPPPNGSDSNNSVTNTDPTFEAQYPIFQDVHVMIFIGFGFLMTFLKKYAYSAIGFTFFVSSLVIQWGILCHGFFEINNGKIHVNLKSIIHADVAAAVSLISLGALLGKISPVQLIGIALLETAFFTANEYLNTELFEAVDAGGSMYVHVFGAYFGLAASFVLARGVSSEDNENNLESSSYQNDINSLIGTIFLWLFWPSFNSVFLSGDQKQRAVINTYLSLTSSCLVTFALSAGLNKKFKFEMAHVQNATLAGGVCVGTVCNMMVHPYGALLIGGFAGVLSTIGFRFIQGFLLRKFYIHDTCGVHNLHGMPGVAAGLIGVIMAALANKDTYGLTLFQVFPAMGGSKKRSSATQAGYQMVGLSLTLAVSILTGLITGGLMKPFQAPTSSTYYNDEVWWNVPEI